MYIKLFSFAGAKAVAPTEHCYQIKQFKDIIDNYPDNHCKIFAYLQYMYSWNPDDNPYLAMREEDREQTILQDIVADFSTEDDLIQKAINKCKQLFELPVYRAWRASKTALDGLSFYLETTKPSSGKDGSIGDIRATIKDLPALNKAYNEGYQAFLEDVKVSVRGDKFISAV
jgi:hypothetical protein